MSPKPKVPSEDVVTPPGGKATKDEYVDAMKRYLERKPRKIDWPDGRRPTREELYDCRATGPA